MRWQCNATFLSTTLSLSFLSWLSSRHLQDTDLHCRQSLYFLHSSSIEQKGIATWFVRVQLQQWWIGTLNYVVVYLHNNAISSIFYDTFSWPGLLSALSPSWYFCEGVSMPLLSATSEWCYVNTCYYWKWPTAMYITLWSWEVGPNVTNNKK